tara:strand:- start:15 stop:1097 length:1083 start_codon:yes stop_codon:yes gene_type:complete
MRSSLIHKIFNKSITSNNISDKELKFILKICEHHRIKQIFIDKMHMSEDRRSYFRDYAKKFTKYSLSRDLKILSELDNLKTLFHDQNINFVFLKGTALKNTVYEQTFWRDCRDIDILVNKHEVKNTLELLLRKGFKYKVASESQNTEVDYNFSHQAPVLVSPSGQFLEVHYRITMDNTACKLSEDIIEQHKENIAPHHLNLIHVIYHALVTNKLNNGLMSLIDINFLINLSSEDQIVIAAKKYNLQKEVKHMIDLLHVNTSSSPVNIENNRALRISNDLIHAGEKLVGFKVNLKNIKHSIDIFQKKYFGDKKNTSSLREKLSLMGYVCSKLYFHILSVLSNPSLWIKRNELKKYINRKSY